MLLCGYTFLFECLTQEFLACVFSFLTSSNKDDNSEVLGALIFNYHVVIISIKLIVVKKWLICDIFHRNPETAALMAFKSIRSQLTRERLKSRPKLPQSIAALADELIHYTPINHIYKGSVTASDGKTAFLFSDDKLLIALESSNEIYCDGTFSVSLTIILQLFSCVGTINKYRIWL